MSEQRSRFIERLKYGDLRHVLDFINSVPENHPHAYLVNNALLAPSDYHVMYPESPDSDGYVITKFSKYLEKLNKVFQVSFDVQYLANVWYESTINEEFSRMRLKLLHGLEIADFYTSGAGGLESCMVNKPPHFYDLYVANIEKVALAVLEYKNRILARALVWFGAREYKRTVNLMSRIYAVSAHERDMIRKLALREGWYVPYSDSKFEYVWTGPDGDLVHHPYVVVDLPVHYYSMWWPYIDHLHFVHRFLNNSYKALLSTRPIEHWELKGLEPEFVFDGKAISTSGGLYCEKDEAEEY